MPSTVSAPPFHGVRIDSHAGVLTVTLDRPEALNALNGDMLAGIEAVLDLVESDSQLTALVFRGRGRVFCAGADLKAARNRSSAADDTDATRAFLARASALFRRIETLPLPTIAVVEGLVVAGGLELVLCCDLVVASEAATFGDAHANYGLLPGGCGSVRLPRKVGPMRAKYLMFTGQSLPASRLAAWGLVTAVAAPARLEATVDELLETLRHKSPLRLRRMKELVDANLALSLDAGLEHELAIAVAHAGSYDRQEGLAAFQQKRQPIFLGR